MSSISEKRDIFIQNYNNGIRSQTILHRKTKLSMSTIKRYLEKMKTKKTIKNNNMGRPCVIRGKKLKSLITSIRHHPDISSKKLGVQYQCSNKTIQKTLKKKIIIREFQQKHVH